jgi:hypothetical protein
MKLEIMEIYVTTKARVEIDRELNNSSPYVKMVSPTTTAYRTSMKRT